MWFTEKILRMTNELPGPVFILSALSPKGTELYGLVLFSFGKEVEYGQ